MTPCEKRGLHEGQWVWNTSNDEHVSSGWVILTKDDNTDCPWFRAEGFKGRESWAVDFRNIDWSQGIHDEKPSWTPREYGGEGQSDDPRDFEFWRDAPEWAGIYCRDSGEFFEDGDIEPCSQCVHRPETERAANVRLCGAEEIEEHDPVDSPYHYVSGDIECIEAMKAQCTREEFEGHLRCSVVKYMWRWRDKGGAESLAKARWYLDRLIDEQDE